MNFELYSISLAITDKRAICYYNLRSKLALKSMIYLFKQILENMNIWLPKMQYKQRNHPGLKVKGDTESNIHNVQATLSQMTS